MLWDLDPDRLMEQACNLANRNLSRQEWRELIGADVSHRDTCAASR